MTSFAAVLMYVVWIQLLALSYAFPRVPMVLMGTKKPDTWERDKPNTDHVFMVRAKGAHLNCVENFALFAAVVVIAALMDKSAVVDQVAGYFIAARIGQSVAHLAGTALPILLLRGGLFLAQLGMIFWVCFKLLA